MLSSGTRAAGVTSGAAQNKCEMNLGLGLCLKMGWNNVFSLENGPGLYRASGELWCLSGQGQGAYNNNNNNNSGSSRPSN